MQRNWSGFKSVLDGLEGVWDNATKEWRETQKKQVQAALNRVGQVSKAMFENRPPKPTARPETGPIDRPEINRRIQQTQDDITRNLEAARASGYPEAMAGAWPAAMAEWLHRVWFGNSWDDKSPSGGRPHPSGIDYERQGNFSYGATAATLGLPKSVALAGAGAAQRLSNFGRALGGKDLTPSVGGFAPPYGDDPRDQTAVADGYDYGARRLRDR